MSCKTKNLKTTKICIGDLNKKIKIYVRTLTALNNGVDFDEVLSNTKEVWAGLETTSGKEVFDGTNLKGMATHIWYIRALAGQTAEDWIEFNGEYYDILSVEDLREDNRFQKLMTNVRGTTSNPVNLA